MPETSASQPASSGSGRSTFGRRISSALVLVLLAFAGCEHMPTAEEQRQDQEDYWEDEAAEADLDCEDFDGPVEVPRDDPHGLDRDGDGIGCEQP